MHPGRRASVRGRRRGGGWDAPDRRGGPAPAAGGSRGLSPGQDLHPLRGLPTPPGGGGLPPGQEAGGPAQRGGEHHLLVRRHRRLPGLELPLRGLAHHLGGLAGSRGVLGGDRRHPLPGAAVPFQVLTPVRPLNANTPPAQPGGCSHAIRASFLRPSPKEASKKSHTHTLFPGVHSFRSCIVSGRSGFCLDKRHTVSTWHERTESTSFTGQFVRLDPPLFLPSQSYAGTYQSMTIFTIIYISKTVSEHMTDTVLLNTLLIL